MLTNNLIAVREIIGNPIVDVNSGEMIAKVKDIKIDPQALKAVVAVTSTGGLFSGSLEAIQAGKVEVWGRDALLVKQSDVIIDENELDIDDKWLSGSDDIRGYDVVAKDGTRIGLLADIFLDNQGQIRGYRMSDVFIDKPVAETKWLDVDATHSFGPDVLIIKSGAI